MREAGAAVTVRTYWAWETTATLRLLGGARGAGAPTGEERGGGEGISCCHAHSLLYAVVTLYIRSPDQRSDQRSAFRRKRMRSVERLSATSRSTPQKLGFREGKNSLFNGSVVSQRVKDSHAAYARRRIGIPGVRAMNFGVEAHLFCRVTSILAAGQWRHQLWGTGTRAPLELVQVVIFTLHVCSVAFPVHVKLVT